LARRSGWRRRVHSALAHILLGIAEGALQAGAAYTREISRPWLTSGVDAAAKDPYILVRYGEFVAELSASLALADQAGRRLEEALARGEELSEAERGIAAVETYKSKIHSTDVALKVTSGIFELMGARATARRYAFDRYWRDVRTLTLHDPGVYKAREVGDHFLNGRLPAFTFYS
jgi:alkylation response protein AidB-like acyl-CoA dehydrogenase